MCYSAKQTSSHQGGRQWRIFLTIFFCHLAEQIRLTFVIVRTPRNFVQKDTMPAILNNLKNVTHFVSEIYYTSIFLPQKDKRTHKVAFQNTPRNPSGNMNYRPKPCGGKKQIFFNCYCKSPSWQLFFAYISISPANLVSFF